MAWLPTETPGAPARDDAWFARGNAEDFSAQPAPQPASQSTPQDDIFQYTKALAGFARGQGALDDALAADEDPDTLPDRYRGGLETLKRTTLESVNSPILCARLQNEIAAQSASGLARVSDLVAQRRGDAERTAAKSDLDDLLKRYAQTPAEAARVGFLQAAHLRIDGLELKGLIGADGARQQRRDFAVAAYAERLRNMPPQERLAALDGATPAQGEGVAPSEAVGPDAGAAPGEPTLPAKPVDMLPAPLRAEMRAQAQEQIEAEKRDADVAATRKENEARQASDRAEAAQRKAILENDPNVTAQSLLADPALSAEAKARLGGLFERTVKPDPALKSSGIESGRLLARLYKDDSDPERLADVAPIYDAYTKGRVTRADFEFLLKAFDEQHAAGGDGLFALRRADFLKRARAEIEKPDFVTGEISDEARYESYLFERDLDRKIEDYRKAGKDPFDLLDPNKPDYAGRSGALPPQDVLSTFEEVSQPPSAQPNFQNVFDANSQIRPTDEILSDALPDLLRPGSQYANALLRALLRGLSGASTRLAPKGAGRIGSGVGGAAAGAAAGTGAIILNSEKDEQPGKEAPAEKGPGTNTAGGESQTEKNLKEILMPGDVLIGTPNGKDETVRNMPGGQQAAEKLYEQLSKGGIPTNKPKYKGKGVDLPGGGFVGIRPPEASTSGVPAIDIDIPGIDIEKIHFPERHRP